MRVSGSWSLLLAASFMSSLALAEQPPPEPAPPSPSPSPSPPPADDAASAPSASEVGAGDTAAASPGPSVPSPNTTPLAEARAGATTPVGVNTAPSDRDPPSQFTRDFSALPLTLEARFAVNARLGSSFDDATEEERFGPGYAFGAYIGWKPEFALGLELDHSRLGRVRALSGQTSVDNEYSATGAWIGARVFPIRRERLDIFVNLRIGMVWQHVDARGTRESASIAEPARTFSCATWDGPGLGLGGALGLAYRLGRRVAFVSRIDLNGERLSGESLGTCADGIGSVASLAGSVGLAFEFETAPK